MTSETVTPWRPVRLTVEVITRHQREVWRYLRFLGCDPAVADDLTQEAFLALLRQPPRAGDIALSRWLRTTALNLFRNSGRQPRRGVVLDEDALEKAWARNAAADNEYLEALRHCLARLPADQRRALKLRYGQDCSRAQAAAALGLGVEGVKSVLRRARARLLHCMRASLEDREGSR